MQSSHQRGRGRRQRKRHERRLNGEGTSRRQVANSDRAGLVHEHCITGNLQNRNVGFDVGIYVHGLVGDEDGLGDGVLWFARRVGREVRNQRDWCSRRRRCRCCIGEWSLAYNRRGQRKVSDAGRVCRIGRLDTLDTIASVQRRLEDGFVAF